MLPLVVSPHGIASGNKRVNAAPPGVWITHIALLAVERLRAAAAVALVVMCLKLQKQASLMAPEEKP